MYEEIFSRSILFRSNPKTKILFSVWKTEYCIVNSNIIGDKNYHLVAPFEFRQKILGHLHNNRTARHLGRDKTILSIKQRYYRLV